MAEINYLPICLIAFGVDILYFVLIIGLVTIICGIIVYVKVRSSMLALVSSNIHHLAPHLWQGCRFFIQDIFLGTVLVQ